MKRFQFKLQAVLTLRQRAEQAALEKYARAIQLREAAAEKLAQTDLELCDARRQWLNAMADGCPAARAAQMLAFCHLMEERKKQREQALHLADVEVSQSSQKMLLARQQREAIEKFLVRQRQGYERLLRQEEHKLIDDLANRRAPASFPERTVGPDVWN